MMPSTLLSREFLAMVATWAGIFAVVFTTVGTLSGITYVLASRALKKKFDLKDRTAVEAQVATVQLNAETSNAEAQQASENAALASERAVRANERASENDNEPFQLGIIAEDERIARQRLVKSIAPRRLTEEQRETLSKLLRPMSGGSLAIVSPISDPEASDFADDFNSAIRTGASWNTLRILDYVGEKKCGVFVGMLGKSSSAQITLLSHALDVIGVSHRIVAHGSDEFATTNHFLQQRILFLLVGHKPQPLAEMK